jgi:hypothetical protein
MTKKHFIALANYIRDHPGAFSWNQILHIAHFCQSQNRRFMRDRWTSYIRGECGPNGGRIRRIRIRSSVMLAGGTIQSGDIACAPLNFSANSIGCDATRTAGNPERGYEEENFE